MKTFKSPLKFAEHLITLIAVEELALHEGLKLVAKKVEETAKAEIGQYQPQVGSFPAWEKLTDATIDDRIRKGFNPEDPLLRSGALRDSISNQVKGLEAAIGSNSDIMVYQEFGTATIPARPVLGPAVFRNKKNIQKIVGSAAVTGLTGEKKIHPSLGYDMNIE